MDNLLLAGACLAAVERAVAEMNLSAVLPLGRQHSLLNTIEMLIHKMGHLIHIYLPKVLQILLCITASVHLYWITESSQENAENVLIYPFNYICKPKY